MTMAAPSSSSILISVPDEAVPVVERYSAGLKDLELQLARIKERVRKRKRL
jgi:hypothetical protein